MVMEFVSMLVGVLADTLTLEDRDALANVISPLPLPAPHGTPVPDATPDELTCTHCVKPVIGVVSVPPTVNPADMFCNAVHVFAFAGLSDATTLPVVGEITRLPSEFDTLVTAPPPEETHVVVPSVKIEHAGVRLL